MPELTGHYYRSFLKYFSTCYPELRKKFPEELVWSLIGWPSGMMKPEGMSDVDFDKFREIEHLWLVKNRFISVPNGKISFILPKKGLILLKPEDVLKIDAVDSNTTKFYLREQGVEHSLNVFGSLESVKNKLNLINA